jgi:hypothetical protein
MNFIFGMLIGGLIMAFTPNLALEIRKATNTAASEVERATSDEAKWEELYRDTVEALAENAE